LQSNQRHVGGCIAQPHRAINFGTLQRATGAEVMLVDAPGSRLMRSLMVDPERNREGAQRFMEDARDRLGVALAWAPEGLVPEEEYADLAHYTRDGAALNLSPEPVSNWTASVTEDVAVVGGLWAALHYPWIFLLGLAVFVALVLWLVPKLLGALRRVLAGRREPRVVPAEAARVDLVR